MVKRMLIICAVILAAAGAMGAGGFQCHPGGRRVATAGDGVAVTYYYSWKKPPRLDHFHWRRVGHLPSGKGIWVEVPDKHG